MCLERILGRLGEGVQHGKALLQGRHQYVVDGLSRAPIHRDRLIKRRPARGFVPILCTVSPIMDGGWCLQVCVVGRPATAPPNGGAASESSQQFSRGTLQAVRRALPVGQYNQFQEHGVG